ncbi:retinitis pigmentosa 1-like 1 protein [Nerophis ophidion]|uniref:retinitis pigmentosa 1-like 1 protein n=1 Tax=Nerophis ophidion TaxID=159077 RepID=UPI002AE01CBB|nr:retinitis pigmentosa 1-like 1 protein [Nerophis ophidion]XP_061745162.1 retinitis pigmentosa 1-like 1 protein [Nerophis ophidion]
MHSAQEGPWDPQAPSKHVSTPQPQPLTYPRLAHTTTATPAKRITFYKSGDSQFGGVRMAIHKRSFKCFDALLDDLSQKVPLPFGVRTVTTPRGTHIIKDLEELQDGGCYLCSDRRQAKPVNMELAGKRQSVWHQHSRVPQQAEALSASSGHVPHRHLRILLVKNTEPGIQRSLALNRRSTRSMRAFLEEASEVMHFHVRKLYTAEGRKVDNIQSLMSSSGVMVCVGREALNPMLLKCLRKTSEEKLPGLGSRSPGLGPRMPGNGARSPGFQEVRSPPHGAQSRASECSEGQDSKKNVNFGLETKKSIIHPRSDSSARSTRFSLSSEKSFGNSVRAHSQQRSAFMNDDIEKRVLVNKDGSLSVEMRVRFRLRNDETLQWSTQIRKSPSLTSESCPPSHVQRPYLQNGHSESCSDSASFDPDCTDYSSQSLNHTFEGIHCTCCYQGPGQHYNLWENPVHSHKQPPVPPPHTSSHTTIRHTHSSSSSSSCNSRRVVRCRTNLSNSGRGSNSEQSQLVQEETCVTEQIESRVDIEQNGDTHVEVCKVSRCSSHSEVITLDGNPRLPRERSPEEELMEEEVGPPLSTVSSSSHILQSLKEDQDDDDDDDLPPSASQCSHRSEPPQTEQNKLENKNNRGSGAASAATSCLSGATITHTPTGPDEMNEAPRSRCSSAKVIYQRDESEEIGKALSVTPVQSVISSVCSHCGGYKHVVNPNSNSRASQRSNHIPQACSKSTSPLASQSNAYEGTYDDALSIQSNKTNLTRHGSPLTNAPESRTSSAMSRMSNSKTTEAQEGATSVISHESSTSQKSSLAGATAENKERSSSVMSGHKSNCSGTAESPSIPATEEAEENSNNIEAEACISPKTVSSVRVNPTGASTAVEDNDANVLPRSCLSVASNASTKSSMAERPTSVRSTKSSKSNISGKSKTSHKLCARDEPMVVHSNEEKETPGICPETLKLEDNKEGKAEERAPTALSSKSTTSCQTSYVSDCIAASPDLKEADIPSPEPNGKPNANEERVTSAMSIKSKTSVKTSASQMSTSSKNLKSASSRPNVITINSPEDVDETSEATGEGKEVEENLRKTSEHLHGEMLSPTKIHSPRTHLPKAKAASPISSNEARGQSSLSVYSTASAKSEKLKCHCSADSSCEEGRKKEVAEKTEAEEPEDNLELNRRKDPGDREQLLSPNSSGSISLGLPDDQEIADSDSCKSCVSFHTSTRSRGRLLIATPNAHKTPESILSHKSNVTVSTQEVHIPTIEVPGVDGDDSPLTENCSHTSQASKSDVKNLDDSRSSSSLSSASAIAKNSKIAEKSDGAVADSDSTKTSVSTAKKEDFENNEAVSAHSSSSCYLGTNLAAGAKVKVENAVKANDSGSVLSVKTSSSSKKERSVQSSRPLHNSRPCSKAERCGESTMTAAADLLNDIEASSHQQCQQSKASKGSSKSTGGKSKRRQKKGSQKNQDKVSEVTPACLPNASPSEVVSDWLRSIPSNSSMLALDDLTEFKTGSEVEAKAEKVTELKQESPDGEKVDKEETVEGEKAEDCLAAVEETDQDLAPPMKTSYQPLPKHWRSSAAVMKVLLSSSMGRCRSLPEVSPVYGRRLSTSARGLLDCLAQLQLIEPTRNQGHDKIENQNRQYEDIMAILQSLWLTDPRDIETKGIGTEQVTPPRSSSGVGMSSGSGGSGKDHENQGGDETLPKESSQEDEAVGKDRLQTETKEIMTEAVLQVESLPSEDLSKVLPTLESQQAENPSSSDHSSTNNTFNSSSGTPPTVLQKSLSKKTSHEPDPVWLLHLLKKLEKQFMNHYIDAMKEFKVRWDLDDSLILDTMISELKDEVSSRIQSSIEREMRNIQSRAGRGEKMPRPPKNANLSRESTMTEKRRRILKVIRNQSVKTADSASDEELTAEFSDQRSDDEYCPCEACVRKKMEARPLKMHPAAAEAPVMMEFDLLKILQHKKTPEPAPPTAPQPPHRAEESAEEGRSLEVVKEEEEDDEDGGALFHDAITEEGEEDTGGEVRREGEERKSERSECEISGWRRCQCRGGQTPEGRSDNMGDEEEEGAEGRSDNMGGDGEEEVDEAEDVGGTGLDGSKNESEDGEEEDSTHRGNDDSTLSEEGEEEAESEEEEAELGEEGKSSASAGAEDDNQEENATEKSHEESPQKERASAKGQRSIGGADDQDWDTEVKGRRQESQDGALLHQTTRTSVESQPGSSED